MIRLASAAALALLVATPALAAPTLRHEAVVSADVVTVGDLIDGAEGLEGVALFRAPDPGQTGPVSASVAMAAARRAGVQGLEAGDVREIFVTRSSREITPAELEGAITARAATELGADVDTIEVRLDARDAIHVDAADKGAVEIVRYAMDPRSGRFEAAVELTGRRRGEKPIRVTGSAIETIEVATLARAFERGEIVAAADLRKERRPKTQSAEAISPGDVVGLAAKRSLREGQPLRSSDLMRPQHVERGGFVTLIYASSGMSLSLKAKAMSAGAQGDMISVQNIQSKRVVSGVVTGPSEVTVTAGATTVARR